MQRLQNRRWFTKINKHISKAFVLSLPLISCNKIRDIEQKSYAINRYEQAVLTLSKKNRELEVEISRLTFEINSIKSKNDYMAFRLKEKTPSHSTVQRSIASIPQIQTNDLVKFETYYWGPEQMLTMAEEAFKKKDYEKAAQFFHQFSVNFPNDKRMNDVFLFQAGVSSFESGNRQDLALDFLKKIIENYPKSEFYRGAKLWKAFIHLKNGNRSKFFEVVEEFRRKYRNTQEWSILSKHYEKHILQNT